MRIATVMGFGGGGAGWWGEGLPTDILTNTACKRTIGGGEEATLETAFGLAAAGHTVDLWWYGDPGQHKGVTFYGLKDDLYRRLLTNDYDAIIAWSTLHVLEVAKNAGLRAQRFFAQQLNDLLQMGDWSAVDCIISPSYSHSAQLAEWGWKERPYAVVYNGLHLERHAAQVPWGERPLSVGYWSSPDRGLHHLLRVWPKVVKREPTAKLHVFYEVDKYLKMAMNSPSALGDRARVLVELKAKAEADPSVTFHGAVPRDTLAQTQNNCRVQCYPYQPAGGYCHPAGTLVLTQMGLRPVEALTLTDKVLGKSGQWRDVTALRSRRYEGKLIRILPACGEEVAFTDDHPVYVARNEKSDFMWVRADEVRVGDWLFSAAPEVTELPTAIPLPKFFVYPKRKVPASQFTSASDPLPDEVLLSSELCRLVGYFAGDGNAPTRGRTAADWSLFFGTEQKAANVEDAQHCLKKVFGLSSTLKDYRPAKKMVAVKVFNTDLCRVFSAWSYASDGKKQLPAWVMTLSRDLTEEVLKGLWRTDGSVWTTPEGSRMASYTSTSERLIGQVRTLLNKCGRTTRINRREHGNGKFSYVVLFSIAEDFLDYTGRVVRGQCGSTYTREVPNGRALKVREVEVEATSETVYALTVDRDESYHVGNFLVHNCEGFGGAVNQGIQAGCHVLLTPHDAFPELYDGRVTWLPKEAQAMERVLVEKILYALHTPPPAGAATLPPYTWERATEQMLEALTNKSSWKLTGK